MSVRVDVLGSGPDLALIHGWGMHGGVWGQVAEPLAHRFRLHLVDLPGHGASPPCHPYDLPNLARAVAQALPPRIGVVGWSLGGLVAQQWALDRPRRVERLMLVGTSPCFVARSGWPSALDAAVLESFAADLQRDYAATLLRFLSLQVRDGDKLRVVLKSLRGVLFSRGEPDSAVLHGGLDILLQADLRDRVAELGMPVRVVHGERDGLAPVDAGRWLARTIPGATETIIPGCAHAPFLSHPASFLHAVEEFFR